MGQSTFQQVGRLIAEAGSFLLVSHIRADGDAIGSLLGMGLSLQAAGKRVQMALPDGPPSRYKHLPGIDQVRYCAKEPYDLSIVLDCSDLARTGTLLKGQVPDINIDHHITNLNFARYNLVDPKNVATSAILAENLPSWGLPITPGVAEVLLTGIVSDSLGFRTTNTSPQSLRTAASLMELGGHLSQIYQLELYQRSFEAARYWSRGLANMQRENGLIWTTLSLADRIESGYPGNDDADLVNILSSIEGMDISIIFTEQKNNNIKVSWRARPGLDVTSLALQFGGGGHPAASGADVSGTLEQVVPAILDASRKYLSSEWNTERETDYLSLMEKRNNLKDGEKS